MVVALANNVFALLADQQGMEASTIVALKSTEVKKIAEKKKKIAEEKKKAEAKKKKKKICVKEQHGHGEKSLDGNAVDQTTHNGHQHNLCSDVASTRNTGGGQADQKQKIVNHHANDDNQAKVSVVLSREEFRERWLAREKEEEAERKERLLAREAERQKQWLARAAELARETERKARYLAREAEREEQRLAREKERKEEEAKRQEQWLAREAQLARETELKASRLAREAEREEQRLAREQERKKQIEEKRKKEMAMKTLQEYEQEKAYEKQKAALSVPEATLDNVHTKQKSKDIETAKKDSNIKKNRKVHKTMSVEEFLKLPTGREGQDGPGNQDDALPDEDNTVKMKEGSAPDLSETSFPVLGKVTNSRKDDTC